MTRLSLRTRLLSMILLSTPLPQTISQAQRQSLMVLSWRAIKGQMSIFIHTSGTSVLDDGSKRRLQVQPSLPRQPTRGDRLRPRRRSARRPIDLCDREGAEGTRREGEDRHHDPANDLRLDAWARDYTDPNSHALCAKAWSMLHMRAKVLPSSPIST